MFKMIATRAAGTIPAKSIAFCSKASCKSAKSPPAIPQAPVIINKGVRLPTNMQARAASQAELPVKEASFHPFETLYPIIQAAFPSLVNCLLFLVLLYYSSLFFLAFVLFLYLHSFCSSFIQALLQLYFYCFLLFSNAFYYICLPFVCFTLPATNSCQ